MTDRAIELTAGMAVRCIDRSSRRDFAEWYADERYSEDMLSLTRRYIIRATLERDGRLGVDIGVPTPWGDPFWSADRFERCLLREPSLAGLASVGRNPAGHDRETGHGRNDAHAVAATSGETPNTHSEAPDNG